MTTATKARNKYAPLIGAVAFLLVLISAMCTNAPCAYAASSLKAGSVQTQVTTKATKAKAPDFWVSGGREQATIQFTPTGSTFKKFNAKTTSGYVNTNNYTGPTVAATFQYRYTQGKNWKKAKKVTLKVTSMKDWTPWGPGADGGYHYYRTFSHSKTMKNLKGGKTVKVQMRTLGANGWSKWSKTKTAKISTYAKGTVKNVKAKETKRDREVKVTWKAVKGAKRYQISARELTPGTDAYFVFDSIKASSKNQFVINRKNATAYFMRDVYKISNTRPYEMKVRYKDSNGNWSKWSKAAKVTLHH